VRSKSTPIRSIEELAIGVGEHGELPAAGAGLLEGRLRLGERVPARQRAAERVLLVGGSAEAGEHDGHHLAIAPSGILALDLRLELVVGAQQLAASRGAEQSLELAPDPAVPVDQRAVAVERGPALHGASLSTVELSPRTA
jgi:hypothetical protein